MRQGTGAVLVGVLLLSLTLVPASGGPLPRADGGSGAGPAATSWPLTITAVNTYGYQPGTFGNVPLHTNIVVTFKDGSVLPHTFNLSSREGFEIPTDWSAAQLTRLYSEYKPLYAASVSYEGDVSVGNFTSPSTPGWYEFICNVSGHFTEGMYGFIAFGEPLPSNVTLPNPIGGPGPSYGSGLLAGIGVAIIAVILVAVVIWRQRRSPYRPPPM